MKLVRIAMLAGILACLFAVPARADVSFNPIGTPSSPTPLGIILLLAVVVVAVSLIVRAVGKKRKDRDDDRADE